MTARLPTLQNDDGTIALTQAPTSSGSRSSSSTGTLAPAPPLSRAQIRGIVVADVALAWTGYGVPVESWRSKLENFRACWNPSLTGLRTPALSPTETARAAPEPTSIAKPTAFPHSMIQGHTATYVTGTMAPAPRSKSANKMSYGVLDRPGGRCRKLRGHLPRRRRYCKCHSSVIVRQTTLLSGESRSSPTPRACRIPGPARSTQTTFPTISKTVNSASVPRRLPARLLHL